MNLLLMNVELTTWSTGRGSSSRRLWYRIRARIIPWFLWMMP